ncbi:MAG: tetratricopeptide repeat protein [Myxococcota bacterium]
MRGWLLVLLAAPALAALEDGFTPAERALLVEVDQQHFIKARDQAEKILADTPGSFAATWAMARVHHDEEGNHARALAWVRRAQKLLGERDRDWAIKLLLEEHFILAEMNRNEEALEVLDRYEEKYGPPPAHLRIWPLFKSGRSEEARVIALKLTSADSEWDRADGYNGLLSIAFEEHDRQGTWDWAMKGVRATPQNCTIVRNAASAAFTRLRLDEAEELSLKAKKLKDCIDPVDNQLASLAILMGQFQQAVSALESSRTTYIEKRYRPHFALARRGVLVDLLDAVGQPAEAVKLARELYGQQQRMGASSSAPEIERLSRTLRYSYALDGRVAQLEEQAAYAELPGGPAVVAAELSRTLAARWEVRRALVQLLSGDERLLLMTRPAMGEVSDWPSWRTGDLIDVVGTGVMRASIKRARVVDAHFPETEAPLDALEAEVAFHEGNWKDTVRLASSALERLPKREAMLRWRVMTVRGEALRRLGRLQEAQADFAELLQRWPTAFRAFHLAVPVKLTHDGSALAKDTAARLGRSPRFTVQDQAPWQLLVTGRAPAVDVCLLDSNGGQLACASGEGASKALDAFHAAAFAPKVSLTQSDLKSLDGSPVRVGADQALKGLLGN